MVETQYSRTFLGYFNVYTQPKSSLPIREATAIIPAASTYGSGGVAVVADTNTFLEYTQGMTVLDSAKLAETIN
jgi:hypothetical protein